MGPIGNIRERLRDPCLDHDFGEAPADVAARESPREFLPYLQFARAELERAKPAETRAGGIRYTGHPHEVPVKTTTPKPVEVVSALHEAWPALTYEGARTLAAQFMAETGNGRYCFDWNLGNVKSGPNEPHMYLRNVWEVMSPERAKAEVERAKGLAHVATTDEIKSRGWSCPAGQAVVVFQPPDPQCRFRAYASFAEGARKWLDYHQAIARNDPTFLASVNRGDTAAVAHALKRAHCYTAAEADYARLMAAKKTELDRALGTTVSG
jgi:hypothetical protein